MRDKSSSMRLWFCCAICICLLIAVIARAEVSEIVTSEKAGELIGIANSYRGVQSGRFIGLSANHVQPRVDRQAIAAEVARYEADLRSKWRQAFENPQYQQMVTKALADMRRKMQAEGKTPATDSEVVDYEVASRVRNERLRLEVESEQRTEVQRFDIKFRGPLLSESLQTVSLHIDGRDARRAGFVTQAVIGKEDYRTYRTDNSRTDTNTTRGFGRVSDVPSVREANDLDMILARGGNLNLTYSKEMFRYAYRERMSEAEVLFIVLESGDITWRIGLLPNDGYRLHRFEAYRNGVPTVIRTYGDYQQTKDGGRYPFKITRMSVRSGSLPAELTAKVKSGQLRPFDRQVLDAATVQGFESWDIKLEEASVQTQLADAEFAMRFPEGTDVVDERNGKTLKYKIEDVAFVGGPIGDRVSADIKAGQTTLLAKQNVGQPAGTASPLANAEAGRGASIAVVICGLVVLALAWLGFHLCSRRRAVQKTA